LFTQFERYLGKAAIMRLEKTYRNSQQLIDVASSFVMKNPQQYKKQLRSNKSLDYPLTFMCYSETPFPVLKRIIDKIIHDAGPKSSILLLGRTNYDLALIQESKLFEVKRSGQLVYTASPETPITFMSVHRSKGLEADNVVVINFENSTLGFPNKIADDPLLSLVLTDFDTYPYAEERRLLYVAITRTRNRVFVLVNENKPSEFMSDFSPSRSVFILSSKNKADRKTIACPRCKTGVLMVRKNESSNTFFVGCSNFPHCDYTIRQTEIMENTRVCQACGGFLVKRHGKWGSFYGCSNYPACNHTEEVNDLYREK
jgi:DNA helicase-4